DIDVQALEQNLRLLAKLDITQQANRIHITAQQEVVINGAGSYMHWGAQGIEQGTQGSWTAKAASHAFVGPDNQPVTLPPPPQATPKDELWVTLLTQSADQQGVPRAGEPYELLRDGAVVQRGLTDHNGQLHLKNLPEGPGTYQLRLSNGAVHHIELLARELTTAREQRARRGARPQTDALAHPADYSASQP
ncbi:DUF2345 domain-containing protein, partial [Roseateles sp. BYS180W]